MSNSKSKGNYLKLYRSTLNSDIMDCTPVVRELWFWLLMSANWKTDEKKNINRGTWTGTIDDIRNGLSWRSGYRTDTYSKSQIARAYGKLTEMGMTDTTGGTGGISISICNYDTYQGFKNTGETTDETIATRSRDTGRKKDTRSYYNNNIIDTIIVEEGKKEYNKESVSVAVKILKIVEPVFGDLVDPFSGLGGISKWGTYVWSAINDYGEDSVINACTTLCDLVSKGEREFNNPKVFFTDSLPGYIKLSMDKQRTIAKQKERAKWVGFCSSCDGQYEFESKPKPGSFEVCPGCKEDYLEDELIYRDRKKPKEVKVKEQPKEEESLEQNEDFQKVQAFLKGFG